MNNQAFEVSTTTGEKILFFSDPRGLLLNYITGDQQGTTDSFSIGLKVSSLKRMLKSLQYGQKYIIDDRSLSAWEENRSLRLRFKSDGIEKQCELSPDETTKLVQFLSQYAAQKSVR